MKRKLRRVITWMLVTVMMITTVLIGMPVKGVEAASSEDRFDEGNYTIQYMLSNCSYCVENKLTNTGGSAHTVGSILAGELDFSQSYGNFFKIPSYIGTITNVGWMCNNYTASEPYIANRVVYYGTDAGSFAGAQIYNSGNGAQAVQNAEYMNLSTAFGNLKSQSTALAAKGSTSAYTYSGGVLTLNFSNEIKNITVSDDLSGLTSIVIKGATVDDFLGNGSAYTVSLTNSAAVNLSFDSVYTSDGSSTSAFDSKMKEKALAYEGGQYYLGGMNLIWNIPNATSVTVARLNGHLVAPKASVTLSGGRHEGNVIASNVNSDSEAHFYPLAGTIVNNGTDPGTNPGTDPKPGDSTKTYDVTISKKAVGASAELTGAKLKVTGRVNGATVDITPITWASSSSAGPKMLKLQPGVYTLAEVEAPSGYDIAEAVDFRVNEDGSLDTKVNGDWVPLGSQIIEIRDALIDPKGATISKQAVGGGAELVGATLTVTGDNLSEPITWVSTSTARYIELVEGEYTLTETVAPKGYAVAESITFKVDSDNNVFVKDSAGEWKKVTNETVIMYDKEAGSLVVYITDKDTKKPIPDASIVIKDENGKEVTKVTTDKEGKTPEVSLAVGSYTVVTEKVPDGYTAPDPITTKITAGALTTEKLVVNSASKTDKTTSSNATKTGDNAGVYGILIVLMVALAGMIATVVLRRKRSNI